jgi:phytanoyl-CoA hydroxylase
MTQSVTATDLPEVGIEDIEFQAEGLDPAAAAACYREHGCLVVRGLLARYAGTIGEDIMATVREAVSLLDRAEPNPNGWRTPDGSLFIQAPAGFERDKQIMVTSCGYTTSGALFRSAVDEKLCDVAEAVLGSNVELFMNGQTLCKEPCGGHPKMLHQDASYFEHKFDGPMAVLSYAVPTDLERGALHVVPGSHKLGMLDHVDTESHLGLPLDAWPWESALPIEGEPGDAIFFHSKTIHGSKPNHSNGPRPVFIHRYRAADDYIVINATTAEARKEAEKHADEAKKENQKGFMVRGRRAHDEAAEAKS